jgi:hypothetical protein
MRSERSGGVCSTFACWVVTFQATRIVGALHCKRLGLGLVTVRGWR